MPGELSEIFQMSSSAWIFQKIERESLEFNEKNFLDAEWTTKRVLAKKKHVELFSRFEEQRQT